MKHVLGLLAIALVVTLVVVPAALAQTKWVRGTVTAVSGDTLTVKVGDKDMSFKVVKDTDLIARGAGTAMREAQRVGAPGVKFGEFVKPGDGVEVHFKEAAGTMTATEIRTGIAAAPAAGPSMTTGQSLRGTVTAVSGSSITVTAEGKPMTFSVSPKTMVIGPGVGTKIRELKEAGKGATVPDLVGINDEVIVTYQDKMASEIRIAMKAR